MVEGVQAAHDGELGRTPTELIAIAIAAGAIVIAAVVGADARGWTAQPLGGSTCTLAGATPRIAAATSAAPPWVKPAEDLGVCPVRPGLDRDHRLHEAGEHDRDPLLHERTGDLGEEVVVLEVDVDTPTNSVGVS